MMFCQVIEYITEISKQNNVMYLKKLLDHYINKSYLKLKKKFQTTLILVFEVIVQPHGNIF